METCISFRRGQSSRPLRRLATLGALALAGASQGQNFNFTDTGMANFFYQKTSWVFGVGGTESTSTTNQGNPGNARQVIHNLNSTAGGGIATAHMATQAVYVMPQQGIASLNLSIDHVLDTSSTATTMRMGFVVEQSGVFYLGPNSAFSYSSYAPFAVNNADATFFNKIDVTQSGLVQMGVNPNFGPGAANLRFGFLTSLTDFETTSGLTASARFDNLSVQGFAAPVPEPASFAAIGVGLAGLVRRKKTRLSR